MVINFVAAKTSMCIQKYAFQIYKSSVEPIYFLRFPFVSI